MLKALISGRKKSYFKIIDTLLDQSNIEYSIFMDNLDNADEFDIIVPVVIEDYAFLNKQDESIQNKCLFPNSNTAALCHDKIKYNDFLINIGLEEFLPKYMTNDVYPYIYKRNQDTNGFHSNIINNKDEKIIYERKNQGHDIYKQEYVAGKKEYSFHVISYQGKILYSPSRRFWFDDDTFVKGFKSMRYHTDTCILNPYYKIFEKIIRKLEYSGTGCINYKIQNGVPKIFEMNPRFGGSMAPKINSYLLEYKKAVDYKNSAEKNNEK